MILVELEQFNISENGRIRLENLVLILDTTQMILKAHWLSKSNTLSKQLWFLLIPVSQWQATGHLGACISDENFKSVYVKCKVEDWIDKIKELAQIARIRSHAAYVTFTQEVYSADIPTLWKP